MAHAWWGRVYYNESGRIFYTILNLETERTTYPRPFQIKFYLSRITPRPYYMGKQNKS